MDDDLVRALLQEQHPDLAELELQEVVGGWGNQMWRLGDELAVRMPRQDRTPDLLLKEYQLVPDIAARVPLPVQTPVRLGKPSDRFPRTWLVTTWVAGEAGDYAPITDPAAADVLVDFLQALHTESPADAPVSDRTGPPRSRVEDFERLRTHVGAPEEARVVWEEALAAPEWRRPRVWLHGDLHPANVVVADGTLAGVIDLEEVCAGDPANDLAAAWVLLPDGAADRVFERYPVDDATVRRARGWAVVRAMFLMSMGRNGEEGLPGGKKHWGPLGRAALERVIQSS
ncbi:aminoglycoside phosphotransferase family protein [Kribbella sp. NPDC026611]|uniref:aminoglycoside phosphotransferase family protein n=1 Tax=Kribbella sp. NPDC026611 TaxID=3154911 RepID=UPI0033C945DA